MKRPEGTLELHLALSPEQMRKVTQRYHVEGEAKYTFECWAAEKMAEDLPSLMAEGIRDEFKECLLAVVKATWKNGNLADDICRAFGEAAHLLAERRRR